MILWPDPLLLWMALYNLTLGWDTMYKNACNNFKKKALNEREKGAPPEKKKKKTTRRS